MDVSHGTRRDSQNSISDSPFKSDKYSDIGKYVDRKNNAQIHKIENYELHRGIPEGCPNFNCGFACNSEKCPNIHSNGDREEALQKLIHQGVCGSEFKKKFNSTLDDGHEMERSKSCFFPPVPAGPYSFDKHMELDKLKNRSPAFARSINFSEPYGTKVYSNTWPKSEKKIQKSYSGEKYAKGTSKLASSKNRRETIKSHSEPESRQPEENLTSQLSTKIHRKFKESYKTRHDTLSISSPNISVTRKKKSLEQTSIQVQVIGENSEDPTNLTSPQTPNSDFKGIRPIQNSQVGEFNYAKKTFHEFFLNLGTSCTVYQKKSVESASKNPENKNKTEISKEILDDKVMKELPVDSSYSPASILIQTNSTGKELSETPPYSDNLTDEVSGGNFSGVRCTLTGNTLIQENKASKENGEESLDNNHVTNGITRKKPPGIDSTNGFREVYNFWDPLRIQWIEKLSPENRKAYFEDIRIIRDGEQVRVYSLKSKVLRDSIESSSGHRFSNFRHLPAEIRNQIWQYAKKDSSRTCYVRLDIKQEPGGTCKMVNGKLQYIPYPIMDAKFSYVNDLPGLFGACRESRSIVQDFYGKAKISAFNVATQQLFPSGRGSCILNFENDRLFLITRGTISQLPECVSYLRSEERNKIKHLAIPLKDYFHEPGTVVLALIKFQKIQTLELVIGDGKEDQEVIGRKDYGRLLQRDLKKQHIIDDGELLEKDRNKWKLPVVKVQRVNEVHARELGIDGLRWDSTFRPINR